MGASRLLALLPGRHFGPGSTSIPGWTVGGNSVDDPSKSYWQAPPGCSYSVDLSGTAPGSLAQTVSTTPGTSYLLQWYMSGNNYCGKTIKTIHVLWDGNLVGTPTFNLIGTPTQPSMKWATDSII